MGEEVKRKDAKIDVEQQVWAQRLRILGRTDMNLLTSWRLCVRLFSISETVALFPVSCGQVGGRMS
jgi:hypothetical protein